MQRFFAVINLDDFFSKRGSVGKYLLAYVCIEGYEKIERHWVLISINSRIRKSLFNFLAKINTDSRSQKNGKERLRNSSWLGDPKTQDKIYEKRKKKYKTRM